MYNLLLVDDERFLTHAMTRLLRHDEYAIYTAADAVEAQHVLKTRPIDLIVSDQKMPGMSGVELFGWAAKYFPNTIRILLTGWPSIGNVDEPINDTHVDRFFMKPCDYDKLRSAIQQELRSRPIV